MDPTAPDTDHAISEANIRPGRGGVVPPIEHRWKPGVSANPGGRPKTKIVTDRLREVLEANGAEKLTELVNSLANDLLKSPDLRQKLLPEILNRLEGKVADELFAQVEQRTKVLVLRSTDALPETEQNAEQ